MARTLGRWRNISIDLYSLKGVDLYEYIDLYGIDDFLEYFTVNSWWENYVRKSICAKASNWMPPNVMWAFISIKGPDITIYLK
ncbi:MAG: hypothetical protein ACRDAX_08480 [Propionibacteriaceae bacterium]